jgi:hypothetical protein
MDVINQQDVFSTSWIEGLALEELNMDEVGVVNFNDHLNPSIVIEESSVSFMNLLRDRFEFYVNAFNQCRGGQQLGSQIKIFKISNTVNDFMLFRNSLRLIISRTSADVISIGFLSPNGVIFRPRLNFYERQFHTPFEQEGSHELKAHIAPFGKITWRFMGEVVDVECMTKHYLSEFVRNSAK